MSMPDGKTYYGSQLRPSAQAPRAQNLQNINQCKDNFKDVIKFINPHYNLKNPNMLMTPEHLISDSSFLNSFTNEPDLETLDWVADWTRYKKAYEQFVTYIHEGSLKKAVPFASFQTQKPKDFHRLYLPVILNKLLAAQTQDQFVYGLWNSQAGFIGQTPEILVAKNTSKSMYSSMALAGTLPSSSPIDMLADPKLANEHQLVIQDISQKLNDHQLQWGKTHEKKYGPIKHLYASVEFESDLDLDLLIRRLSPTSAVGTYPSTDWVKYKDLLQTETRGAYGAPFGLVTPAQTRVIVCLRGLFWDQDRLYIHVGGGMTSQSDYKTEINELELKFESTKAKLGL